MDTRLRGYIRPVLALLLVGVIVGLIFLYYDIDDSGVRAEDKVGNKIEESNKQNTDDAINIESINKYPIKSHEGKICLADSEALDVVDYGEGYYIILSRDNKVCADYLVGDVIEYSVTLVEGKYLESAVGKWGIALLISNGDNVAHYVIDGERKLNKLDEVSCKDARIIACNDTLVAIYNTGKKYIVKNYKDNSILSIDNISDVVGVFNSVDNGIDIVSYDGKVYRISSDENVKSVDLGGKVVDIEPAIHEGKACYSAIISLDGTNIMTIMSRDYIELMRAKTSGASVVYGDRIYAIGKDTIDVYCTCGEYLRSESSDIDEITYIDHAKNIIYYKSNLNEYVKVSMDNGLVNKTLLKGKYVYSSDDFSIISLQNEIVVEFNNDIKIAKNEYF